jgi:hypothetical protein
MEKNVKLRINIKGNWLDGECMYRVPLKEMQTPRLALIFYLLSTLESNAEK